MNKLLKYLPAVLIVASAFVGVAHAQTTGPNYFIKNATSVYPLNPASTTFGTSTLNGIFKNLTISGSCSGSGCSTGGQSLATSSTPTFNGIVLNNTSTLAALKSILNGELDFASATIIYANATSSGNYSDYLTSLCAQAGNNGYTGALIQLPAGTVNLTKTVVDTNHCLYRGVPNKGTVWNWSGGQGGAIAQINQSSSFSAAQPSGGFDGIRFVVSGGSESTTNPIYGIILGGDNGGAYAPIVSNNSFGGLGVAVLSATGTVGPQVVFNTFTFNGRNFEARTAAGAQSGGSGEGELIAFNWISDGRGGTSTLGGVQSGANDCILFGAGSVENAFVTDNIGDNCGVHVMGFNNVFINGFEIENSQSVGNGAYVPFVVDTNTTSHVTIENVQIMNDATVATGTYPALLYAGSNVQVSNVTLNKNGSNGAIPLPLLFMNDGNGGDENLQICNVVNNSAFSAFVTSTVTSFPTSSFSGCLYQVANQAISGEYASASTGQLTLVNVAGVVTSTAGNWSGTWQGLNSSAFSTVSTSTANTWNQLQTFSNGVSVTGTSTLASTTFIQNSHVGFATSTLTATCGPVNGSDNAGAVTFATSSTSCTITFAKPWNFAPICVMTNASSSANIIRAMIITTSTFLFNDTSAFPTSSVDNYVCFGRPN